MDETVVLLTLAGVVLVAAVIVSMAHGGNNLTGWALRAFTAAFAVVMAWNIVVWIS